MNKIYQVYQISDSTGETLDRIFLAIKAQFSDVKQFIILLLELKIRWIKLSLIPKQKKI